ncbi:30S ribosomal protein S20 [Terrisporobacter mayombei]|uniref:30S ribosomal protein S20 n=1 Tax=Terrisporobacter sp. TaxID=1965305 RepID=UPI001651877D|nr:30S ribosomal protein S20 [Terrisporobacter sp.]MBC6696010.1 30S ribosomal protein S20 [Terrisporobacter mayombei]
MANIKSAKKRIKVIDKKTALNKARKSQLKTAIRRFEDAVNAGNKEEATAKFQYAQKRIYQVASKGTIHKNAAARKVAKLAQKLNAMNA